ncbi:beta-lactamase family protein [Hyphobacterium sp. SN044]|uniref:serine hydrolase domain-containing protein n=1 Tax=Hyphobacterium sp. SN044 TaxID=2912575 RepID=UPI001F39CA0F|nr:serine hydrolase [Hyphobacterium sp. SN044]MCF8878851.1 beta-lactamase family protein [Hyphobacterium sp. SN044]
MMVLRILGGILLAVVVAVTAAAAWFFRPWSDYSPAEIQRLSDPARYTDTFQTMDSIFPYRTIEATEPDSLEGASQPLDVTYEWGGETRTLEQYLDESRSLALVVLRDGELVHERYMNGANAGTRLTSWSVAKSFVATMIAMALEEGRIGSLDQLAQEFAPQYAGSPMGETSLRHLLMMSAGVDFNEDYSGPDSDIRPLFFNTFILGRSVDEQIAGIERNREPGQDLHYTSPNTHVLGAVLRGIYGENLAAITQQEIWTPLHMSSDAYWSQNIEGDRAEAIGYCCLNATARDYARFGQFYLQDGIWDGERLLPEGWVEMATTPNAPFQEPNETIPLRGYGLHWWMPENYDGEYFAAGVYGQYIWVDERRGVVIARFAGDPDWGARTGETLTALRAIAETVSPLAERGDE